MKIGFDISQSAHFGGVARYTQQLSKGIANLNQFETAFLYFSLRKPYVGNLPNVKSYKIPPTLAEFIFNKFRRINIEQFIGKVDLYHSSDWIQPPTKAKKVTTYHDVVPIKYPHWSHPKIVEVHRRRLKIVEKEIDRVIAVSQSTKQDLLETTHIPEDKITVIYEGVDEIFKRATEQEIELFRKKYNLPESFFLAIGGIGERRNMDRIKQAAVGNYLVITGQTIPFIPDEELPVLYSAATILLYPSLYEGFGFPILEAMACGLPVITSNVSSMPEIAGDGALLVNPTDVDDIKAKIKMIVSDNSVKNELIKKGYLQSKKFSWKKCIDETVKLYDEVLGH